MSLRIYFEDSTPLSVFFNQLRCSLSADVYIVSHTRAMRGCKKQFSAVANAYLINFMHS